MKISSKGKYALRFMLDLAVNDNGTYIPLKAISTRQELSEKFLEQTSSVLSRAGFIKSVRGANGGYKLAKRTENYTLGSILKLTERNLFEEMEPEEVNSEYTNEQAVERILQTASNKIDIILDEITLKDMVDSYQEGRFNDYVI